MITDTIALNDRCMRAERECEALRAQVTTLLAERGVALALVREAVPFFNAHRLTYVDELTLEQADARLARARALLDGAK